MNPPSVPIFDEDVRPHFQALRQGRVKFQRCNACHTFRGLGRGICPECLSHEFTWTEIVGRGQVHTYVWYFQNLDPRSEAQSCDQFPYNVAIVELEEGPKLATNIEGVSFGQLSVGDCVVAKLAEVSDGWRILRFEPSMPPKLQSERGEQGGNP